MILGFILMGIAAIIGLVSTVLYIMLLVKVFQHAGAGLGILGLFCGPFTYIWGWMKSGELGLKKLMVWLTITFAVALVFYFAGAAALVTSPEMQEQIKKNQADMMQRQAAEQSKEKQP